MDVGLVGANNSRILHSAYLRGASKFAVIAVDNQGGSGSNRSTILLQFNQIAIWNAQ